MSNQAIEQGAIPAPSKKSGFFAGTSGKFIGRILCVFFRPFDVFFGELASYYSAKTFFDTQPQGEFDVGAQLRAVSYTHHDGARIGAIFGMIVYLALFLSTSSKWGWWSLLLSAAGSMIAAAAAGYIAGFSP
jgi:hypothetical protein